MSTVLAQIIVGVRADLAERERAVPLPELRARLAESPPPRDPRPALRSPRLAGIAGGKRARPRRGGLARRPEPATRAAADAAGGAAAISVLTEQRRFRGSLADLDQVRSAVGLPVLRKDFIVAPYQLYESRVHGADLVLLIVAALGDAQLTRLYQLAVTLGMTPLVEVHTPEEAVRAGKLGAEVIGVNNRDLKTLAVDLDRFETLAALLPSGAIKVAESGIGGPADAARLHAAGADAILVGESLVTNGNPAQAVAAMLAATRDEDQR